MRVEWARDDLRPLQTSPAERGGRVHGRPNAAPTHLPPSWLVPKRKRAPSLPALPCLPPGLAVPMRGRATSNEARDKARAPPSSAMDDMRVGTLFRAVRLRRGLRQLDVGRVSRTSQQLVSLLELGQVERVGLTSARRVAAALGIHLDLEPRYRGADAYRLLDADHAALVEAIVRRLRGLGWTCEVEFTFNRYGERGSVDILASRDAGGGHRHHRGQDPGGRRPGHAQRARSEDAGRAAAPAPAARLAAAGARADPRPARYHLEPIGGDPSRGDPWCLDARHESRGARLVSRPGRVDRRRVVPLGHQPAW